MVIYFFYKNFVFTIIHFFFGFLNDFSGQTIIDDMFIMLYNLVFTSIPLGVRGILDITLRPEDGKIVDLLIPFLYKEQKDYPIFTVKKIIISLFKGIIHASLNYFITINITDGILNENGYESNLWVISVCLYTNILLIVTADLIIMTKYHTLINWIVIIFLTFILYIIFLVIVQRVSLFKSMGTMKVTFDSLLVWINSFLILILCFYIDLVIVSFNCLFLTSLKHEILLLKDKNNISDDYIKTLNNPIKDLLFEKLKKEENIEQEIEENKEKEKEKLVSTNVNNDNNNIINDNKIKKVEFKKENDLNMNNNINNIKNPTQNKKGIKIITKKVIKKKIGKKNIIGNNSKIINLKENGNYNKKIINGTSNNNNNLIYNDSIAKSQKQFGSINFKSNKKTNPINILNGINNSQKNSFSFNKDVTERRLLKPNNSSLLKK